MKDENRKKADYSMRDAAGDLGEIMAFSDR
jgi:hypothetical protein